jgi:glycine cleavage system transcriptional repressor
VTQPVDQPADQPATLLAVTVIGHDRPGIIAEATAALAGLGLNLEDSTMTLLRGHFAMMLLCAGDAPAAQVEGALAFLATDGSLAVTVREVQPEPEAGPVASTYVLTVHGADRPGIVSAVAARLAEVGGNITDLTTRLTGRLYILTAEVDLPTGTDVDRLQSALAAAADELGVEATLRTVESDDL